MPPNIKIQKVWLCPSLADLICGVWGNTMCPIQRLVKSPLSSKDRPRWVTTHTDTGNQLVYSPQATWRKCQDLFFLYVERDKILYIGASGVEGKCIWVKLNGKAPTLAWFKALSVQITPLLWSTLPLINTNYNATSPCFEMPTLPQAGTCKTWELNMIQV